MDIDLDYLDGEEHLYREGGVYLARLNPDDELEEQNFIPFQGGFQASVGTLDTPINGEGKIFRLVKPEKPGDIVMIQPNGSKRSISSEQLDSLIKAKALEHVQGSVNPFQLFEVGLVATLDTLRHRYHLDEIEVFEDHIRTDFYKVIIDHEKQGAYLCLNKNTKMDPLLIAELCTIGSNFCSSCEYTFKIGEYYEN